MLCVPLTAHGEALGVLSLVAHPAAPAETLVRLARSVAEPTALALANLRMQDTLRTQSIRDPLTDLFNRCYMEESLEREVRHAQWAERALVVVMADLDHFKRVNDRFGHEAGDQLLRAVGDLLLSQIRGGDSACRYGGEEFTLILPEITPEAARQRCEQLRLGVKHLAVQYRGEPLLPVTISFGIATFPQHGLTGSSLLRAADAALYRAKAGRRDGVVVAE